MTLRPDVAFLQGLPTVAGAAVKTAAPFRIALSPVAKRSAQSTRNSGRSSTRPFITHRTISMRVFHCDHCQQLVFFENVSCIKCGHSLAYLPDVDDIVSLEPHTEGGIWQSRAGKAYRLCKKL